MIPEKENKVMRDFLAKTFGCVCCESFNIDPDNLIVKWYSVFCSEKCMKKYGRENKNKGRV